MDVGVGLDDIVLVEGFFKVCVIDVQQIVDFFIINGYCFWIVFIFDVCCVDDREFIYLWNNKYYVFIFVLQNISLFLGMYLWYYDVVVFDQMDVVR